MNEYTQAVEVIYTGCSLRVKMVMTIILEQPLTTIVLSILTSKTTEPVTAALRIASLRQKGIEGEQKDGMGMTIPVLASSMQSLKYGAANHVFCHVSESIATEMKGNGQPAGIFGDRY